MDADEEEALNNPNLESSALQFEDDSSAMASELPRPDTELDCKAEPAVEMNKLESRGDQEEGEEVTVGAAESEEAPQVEALVPSLIGGGELEASPAISGDDEEVADGGDGNGGQGRLIAASDVALADVIEETKDADVAGETELSKVGDALEQNPSKEVQDAADESVQGLVEISVDKGISMDQEAVDIAGPADIHEKTDRDGLHGDQATDLAEELGVQEEKESDAVAEETQISQVKQATALLEPRADEFAEEAGRSQESDVDNDVKPIGFSEDLGVAQVKEARVRDLADGKESEMTEVPDPADQTGAWRETKVDQEANENGLTGEIKPVVVEPVAAVDEKTEILENDNVAQFSGAAVMKNEAGVSNMANTSDILAEKKVASAVEPSGTLGEIPIERTLETEMSRGAANGESTYNTENDEEVENAEMADAMEDTDRAEETESEAGMDTAEDTEIADMVEGMDTGAADEELEEADELSKITGSKRKRGKNSKVLVRARSRKKVEEDVCFICFDGGDLVLCDRRGCPKAYHTSCVGRDDAFFQSKGRWNCGWHLCTNCKKNAYYMCYTCTFSLCKGCIKNAVIFCIRGNKGLCESCMNLVMLIEENEHGKRDKAQIDFDDKSSWEYLFKDYWTDLKERLSLTSDELALAKNPWKGADPQAAKREANQLSDADEGSDSDTSSGKSEATIPKRRKTRSQSKSRAKEGVLLSSMMGVGAKAVNADENAEWASKELLEIVMHMRDGGRSVLSRMELSQLILDYIQKHKLRDRRNKSYVICDVRLKNLFGKPRVGHIEMLNLLDPHIFFTKEDSQPDDLQESVVDAEANQAEADWNADANTKAKDKKRKSRKKGNSRGLQSNVDDYAAIDMHNINLIYLRRTLVEDLLEDTESFHDKVVGSFVRIRISGAGQKQDLYRLVQVVGTSKVAEAYKVGKRTTDFLLEILNLSKTEVISIDIISNQEFTEDECKRLRQSIKCGLIKRLTVGDIQDKALALQEVRVKDWLESETVRLSHLRDRASETGRRKDLRECVEKLQLLKTPEERQRRLEEVPEIHDDPNMDPSYVSDEEEEADDRRQDSFLRPRGSGFSRRDREPISPRKGGQSSGDSWSGSRTYPSMGRELSRNLSSKGLSSRGDESAGSGEMMLGEKYWNDRETQQPNNWDKPKPTSNFEAAVKNNHNLVMQETASKITLEISPSPLSTGSTASGQINETEKLWHYQDPSGKIQGPFSMVQLRKWNNTGYFPTDLKIWRTTEKQEESIRLTDALAGKVQREPPSVDSFSKIQMALLSGNPSVQPSQQGLEEKAGERLKFDHNHAALNPDRSLVSFGQTIAPSSLEVSNYSSDEWTSSTNLPSPTPNQTSTGGTRGRPFRSKWSPTPAQPSASASASVATPFLGNGGGRQHSMTVTSENGNPSSPTPKSQSGLLLSSTNNPQMHSQSMLSSESQSVQLNVQGSTVADIKKTGAALHNLPVENHGWGHGSTSRLETTASVMAPGTQWGNSSSQRPEVNPTPIPIQPSPYGHWQAGSFPNAGQPGVQVSDPWRPPMPSQSNTQLSIPNNLTWGMGSTENTSAAPRAMPSNQNSGWGPMQGNPNMGWGASLPMVWGTSNQAQVTGNPNQSWPPNQGQVPGSTSQNWVTPQNAVQGWAPPSQGPGLVNSVVPPWMASGQGAGNTNSGWAGPPGNMGTWVNEQNQNGDNLAGQRERGLHGGDPAYGGSQSWNRQPSFGNGGGTTRPPFKGQRVCKYHENGHCKKGAQCDYLHT